MPPKRAQKPTPTAFKTENRSRTVAGILFALVVGFVGIDDTAHASTPWSDWLAAPEERPSFENPIPGAPPPPSVDIEPIIGVSSDPTGDSFGSTPTPDLTALHSEYFYSRNTWQIALEFGHPITPLSAGQPDGVSGFLDIDLDANSATGEISAYAFFCPPPPGGPVNSLGVEAFIFVGSFDPATGTSLMILIDGGPPLSIPTTFESQSIVYDIPISTLQGQQKPEIQVVVGSLFEPTDCSPEDAVPLAPAAASVIAVPTLDSVGLAVMVLLMIGAALRLRRA